MTSLEDVFLKVAGLESELNGEEPPELITDEKVIPNYADDKMNVSLQVCSSKAQYHYFEKFFRTRVITVPLQ